MPDSDRPRLPGRPPARRGGRPGGVRRRRAGGRAGRHRPVGVARRGCAAAPRACAVTPSSACCSSTRTTSPPSTSSSWARPAPPTCWPSRSTPPRWRSCRCRRCRRTGPDRAPVDPGDLPLLLGDVVLCPAVAARQAPEHAGTLDDELALLVVHGVLHVLGHDHAEPDQAERMRARERELLEAHHWDGPAPAAFRQEQRRAMSGERRPPARRHRRPAAGHGVPGRGRDRHQPDQQGQGRGARRGRHAPRARALLRLVLEPEKFLNPVLLTINFLQIGQAFLTTILLDAAVRQVGPRSSASCSTSSSCSCSPRPSRRPGRCCTASGPRSSRRGRRCGWCGSRRCGSLTTRPHRHGQLAVAGQGPEAGPVRVGAGVARLRRGRGRGRGDRARGAPAHREHHRVRRHGGPRDHGAPARHGHGERRRPRSPRRSTSPSSTGSPGCPSWATRSTTSSASPTPRTSCGPSGRAAASNPWPGWPARLASCPRPSRSPA